MVVVEYTPNVSFALDRRLQTRPLIRYGGIFEGIIRECTLGMGQIEVVSLRHNDDGRRIEVERTDVHRQVEGWVSPNVLPCRSTKISSGGTPSYSTYFVST